MSTSYVLQMEQLKMAGRSTKRTALEVAQRVSEINASAIETTTSQWARKWLGSRLFTLMEVPMNAVAVIQRSQEVKRILSSGIDENEPLVIDINKRQVGGSIAGYVPPVVVIEGAAQYARAKQQGIVKIKAWVGELAAKRLVAKTVEHTSMSKLEQTMTLHAGLVTPKALSKDPAIESPGSGVGPRMKQKKGGTVHADFSGIPSPTVTTNLQKTKTRGGSHSEMQDRLGDVEMNDATDAKKKRRLIKPYGHEKLAKATKHEKLTAAFRAAVAKGYKPRMDAKTPPGYEHVVKGLKESKVDNPWAVAWWMKDQGRKA